MLLYNINKMAKKCDYKKWVVIGLLIVVIFFLFHSFSSMGKFEGFASQDEGPYNNCADIMNCNSCHDYTTRIDGKCAWCVNKKKCVAREPPQKGDPNYNSKQVDFIYFDTHQDECTSDSKDCAKLPFVPDHEMHPLLKWFLIKKKTAPVEPVEPATPTTTDSTSETVETTTTTTA
jgi:hypothetical protein